MDKPPITENEESAQYLRTTPCPACGHPNGSGAPFCQHCGRNLSRRNTTLDVLLVVLFAIVGLPSLLVGGCLTIVAISSGFGPNTEGLSGGFLIIGLIGIAIFALLTYLAFFRKKK